MPLGVLFTLELTHSHGTLTMLLQYPTLSFLTCAGTLMVECESCRDWYHGRCVGLREGAALGECLACSDDADGGGGGGVADILNCCDGSPFRCGCPASSLTHRVTLIVAPVRPLPPTIPYRIRIPRVCCRRGRHLRVPLLHRPGWAGAGAGPPHSER